MKLRAYIYKSKIVIITIIRGMSKHINLYLLESILGDIIFHIIFWGVQTSVIRYTLIKRFGFHVFYKNSSNSTNFNNRDYHKILIFIFSIIL